MYLKSSSENKNKDKEDSSLIDILKLRQKYNSNVDAYDNLDLNEYPSNELEYRDYSNLNAYKGDYNNNPHSRLPPEYMPHISSYDDIHGINNIEGALNANINQSNRSLNQNNPNASYEMDFNRRRAAGIRVPQGHPGMNMDSVISHRQFTGHKDGTRLNNFSSTNVPSSYSFFQMINISIFGYTLSEYFFVIMIIMFSYFYIFGKTFNDKYANAWYEANQIYFSKFARVSMKPEIESLKNNTQMLKDAYNIYRYYAEEYKSIKWMTAIIEFKIRQDSSSLISGLVFNIKDKIYYRAAIAPIDPVPNVFCICKKSEFEGIKKSYKDIVSNLWI